MPKQNEKMIALRTGPTDYHFMLRMSNGKWTHKPGNTCILTLKGNPWDYAIWYAEYTRNGKKWFFDSQLYYDSEIKYIVFWR